MRFEFKIHKWANFYFFLQNLSEWHFSNRKSYNIFWRKRLGAFSKEEEIALKKFKKIRLKYPPSKTCFEKAFFLSKKPFQKLSKSLTKEEIEIIEHTFSVFKNKFEVLYKKELPFLEQWKKELHKTANSKKLINKIVDSLDILYKTSIKNKTIDVYLLFSIPSCTGGGANINQQSVSLEISNHPLGGIGQAMGIVWHEVIHLIFQSQYFHPLLRKYFLDIQQKFSPVNEIVTSSLFPCGVLGERILNNKLSVRLPYGVDSNTTKKILNLTKQYLDKKKYFDKEYIKEVDCLVENHISKQ